MINFRIWRRFDLIMLGLIIALTGYGIVMIYSATQSTIDLQELWRIQLTRAGLGLGVMLVLAAIDYHYYGEVYRLLYVFIVVLLATLLVVGEITGGTQRWLFEGAIQPGELTKVILIICLAKYLSERDGEMDQVSNLAIAIIIVLVPMLLIFQQPDLGTTVIIGLIWLVMVLMAGMRLLHLGLMSLSGLMTAPLLWFVMQDYMRQRILLYLDPQGNPDDDYNVQQALISIGSGGFLGKGFNEGTQNTLRFLRVRHTDFLFSVISEELGMLGATILFGLLIFLLWRILRAASLAGDPFGRSICIGVAAMVFFQAFINISVNLRLMPVTGTPLPLVSYGGSSLITFLIALGLVQSVLMHRIRLDFEG